ncbi:hypothetical protein DMB38_20470 [Streptomyces sp. WAC 06738]|uniref:hypothetical protein n=1 Tax=Streptomyces sp. WAC 06738 TaxID=2203210 RepID=UPI000F6E2780|nr:hypothetical protein [Streptomyces sp. WAC 06738]AZM47845.1 hypothetical protein DMB38_20470 [Streptomyces sp. WAC 06738]
MTTLVYTVEVFDPVSTLTVGFFNITVADAEQFPPLAAQLVTAVGPISGGLDFSVLHVREDKPESVRTVRLEKVSA